MGVLFELPGGALDHLRGGVADGGDRDAAAEVDERVAVDVDEHSPAGGRGVDAGAAGQPRRKCRGSAGREFLGPGSGYLGDDSAYLLELRSADGCVHSSHVVSSSQVTEDCMSVSAPPTIAEPYNSNSQIGPHG